MEFPIDILSRFVEPELILISIVAGFFLYLIFFHDTDTKDRLKEIEIVFIIFVLGFIGLFVWAMISFPINIINNLFYRVSFDSITFGAYLIIFTFLALVIKLYDDNYWKIRTVKERLKAVPYEILIFYYFSFFYLPTQILYFFAFNNSFYNKGLINPFGSLMVFIFFVVICYSLSGFEKFNWNNIVFGKGKIITIFTVIILSAFVSHMSFPSVELGEPKIKSMLVQSNGFDASYISMKERFVQNIMIVPRIIGWLKIPINGSGVDVSYIEKTRHGVNIDKNTLKLNLSFFGDVVELPIEYTKEFGLRRGVDDYGDNFTTSNEYFEMDVSTSESDNKIWNIYLIVENRKDNKFFLDVVFEEIGENCTILDSIGDVEIIIDGDKRHLSFDLTISGKEMETNEAMVSCD